LFLKSTYRKIGAFFLLKIETPPSVDGGVFMFYRVFKTENFPIRIYYPLPLTLVRG